MKSFVVNRKCRWWTHEKERSGLQVTGKREEEGFLSSPSSWMHLTLPWMLCLTVTLGQQEPTAVSSSYFQERKKKNKSDVWRPGEEEVEPCVSLFLSSCKTHTCCWEKEEWSREGKKMGEWVSEGRREEKTSPVSSLSPSLTFFSCCQGFSQKKYPLSSSSHPALSSTSSE